MPITYNCSGEWEDVRALLRKFTTEKLLKRINRESRELLNSIPSSDMPAAKWVSYTVTDEKTRQAINRESIVMGWTLVDLAYYAIKASNDHRGKTVETDIEFYSLVDAVEGMRQKEEKGFLCGNEEYRDFLLYLWGFWGEQRKFETPINVFDNTGRELYIIFESSKQIHEKFDVEQVVFEEVGVDWKKVVASLLLAWGYFLYFDVLDENRIAFNSVTLTKDEFLRVISRYSSNYGFIRDSVLERQVFYTKPYVITQKNELISVNAFMNLFIYEHCILWIIRDYYNYTIKKGRKFTAFFGRCFESYFQELLSTYLFPGEYSKISEGKTERADWYVSFGKYRFLIEQKSTILRLAAKQQNTNIDAIKSYARSTIIKAVKQLHNTEKEFGDGSYIKVILLYDDYLQPAVLDSILELDECNIENDHTYWLVSISEMEMLLSLRTEHPEKLTSIIEEKINRELTNSNKGKSLIQIMEEFEIVDNPYIKQDKILFYRDIARHFVEKSLSKESN